MFYFGMKPLKARSWSFIKKSIDGLSNIGTDSMWDTSDILPRRENFNDRDRTKSRAGRLNASSFPYYRQGEFPRVHKKWLFANNLGRSRCHALMEHEHRLCLDEINARDGDDLTCLQDRCTEALYDRETREWQVSNANILQLQGKLPKLHTAVL